MAALCILLLLVCLTDYSTTKIPNVLIAAIGFWGLIYQFQISQGTGIKWYLLIGGLVFIVLYLAYKIGALGAGDVKLFTVMAGFFQSQAVLYFFLYSFLFATALSIVKMLKEHSGKERFFYLCDYIFEVIKTGKWSMYFQDNIDKSSMGIRLSGPAFVGLLLHMAGAY